MHPAAVADAGGLLVLADLLAGERHDVNEVFALDATSLLMGRYLTLRHAGAPHRARIDFDLAGRVVREWYPVRAIAMDVARVVTDDDPVDVMAALVLAEALSVPLVTKHTGLRSRRVPVLLC